jgi:hypothetical protein
MRLVLSPQLGNCAAWLGRPLCKADFHMVLKSLLGETANGGQELPKGSSGIG